MIKYNFVFHCFVYLLAPCHQYSAIFMPRMCLQITKMSIYGVVFGWINANFARRIAFSKEKACVVHLFHPSCSLGVTEIISKFINHHKQTMIYHWTQTMPCILVSIIYTTH